MLCCLYSNLTNGLVTRVRDGCEKLRVECCELSCGVGGMAAMGLSEWERLSDDMLSDDLEEETEEEVVELSEADLLQFLDSQEPSLQVCSRLFTPTSRSHPHPLKLLTHRDVLELKSAGFFIKDACLSFEAAEQLHVEALHLHSLGSLRQASQVGLLPDIALDKFTDVSARGDSIMWLHEGAPQDGNPQHSEGPAGVPAMQLLQELQTDLHSVMRLEKRSAEYQLAVYMGAGSQYVKHRDALPDDGADPNQRRVTAILYANPAWAPAHGGELRLWLPPEASDRHTSADASMANNTAPDQQNNESALAPQGHVAIEKNTSGSVLAAAPDPEPAPPPDPDPDRAAPDRDGNACATEAAPNTADQHSSSSSTSCSLSASAPPASGRHIYSNGCHDITDAGVNSNQLDETSKLQSLRLQDSKSDESKEFSAELRFPQGVHEHEVNGEIVLDVAPIAGRLVVFLSGAIDHAVLPSQQPRVALTAWRQ